MRRSNRGVQNVRASTPSSTDVHRRLSHWSNEVNTEVPSTSGSVDELRQSIDPSECFPTNQAPVDHWLKREFEEYRNGSPSGHYAQTLDIISSRLLTSQEGIPDTWQQICCIRAGVMGRLMFETGCFTVLQTALCIHGRLRHWHSLEYFWRSDSV